jgi:hypothetical protein
MQLAINGITRVLLVHTCQKGVYPRGHVLPLRLPLELIEKTFLTQVSIRKYGITLYRPMSWGSSVSIVSDYRLADRSSIPGRG